MTNGSRRDLPVVDSSTQPYWDAAREGRLLLRRCEACDSLFFYPRPFCPTCWADAVEWIEVSGRATLYTYSVVYQNDVPPFAERVPYVAAVVDLAEGPRMMTNVVDCEVDDLRVGMKLQVAFRTATDEITVPMFAPRR